MDDFLLLLSDLFGSAVRNQVAQFSVAFTFAALIHAHQVKKEIAVQLGSIVEAIKNLSQTLETRIEKVEDNVDKLNERVNALEIPKP